MLSARTRALVATICIHCGEAIDDHEMVVKFEDGQRSHVRCWRPASPARQTETTPPRTFQ